AHIVQPAEYEDAPELTDEQLAEANVHEGGKLIRRGRPPSPARKQPVKLRLDTNVVEAFRATGPGWQTLINTVLDAVSTQFDDDHLDLGARRKRIHALLRALKASKAKKKAATRRASRHRTVQSHRSGSRLHG